MAQVDIGDLSVRFEADISKLDSELKKLDKRLADTEKAGNKAGDSFEKAFNQAKIAAVTAAVIAFVAASINAADEAGKAAQRVGLTTESFSVLSFAVAQADVTMQGFEVAMTQLNKQLAESSKFNGDAAETFRAMGISVRDAHGNLRATEDVLRDIADRFQTYADGAEKVKIATELFGRAGKDMIPLLNQGAAGMRAQEEEARRLGAIVGPDMARRAEEFNDAMRRMKLAVGGFGMRIGDFVTGPGQAIVGWITEFFAGVNASIDITNAWAEKFKFDQLDAALQVVARRMTEVQAEADKLMATRDTAWVAKNKELIALSQQFEKIRQQMEAIRQLQTERQAPMADPTGQFPAPNLDAQREALELALLNVRAEFQAAEIELQRFLNPNVDPFVTAMTTTEAAIARVTDAARTHAITFGQMTNIVVGLQAREREAILDTASAASQALTAVFAESKTANIAAAIMNTGVGVTRALAAGPPLGTSFKLRWWPQRAPRKLPASGARRRMAAAASIALPAVWVPLQRRLNKPLAAACT